MGKEGTARVSPMEAGLRAAMRALDNQIEKEVQRRNPSEREEHGVQKWEPIERRMEQVSSLILDAFGERQAGLDSLLVLSQAFVKALHLVIEELGGEGLGKVRQGYCAEALKRIASDTRRAEEVISGKPALM